MKLRISNPWLSRATKTIMPMMAIFLAASVFTPAFSASTDSLTFTPAADTYVNSSAPTKSYGTVSSFWVDQTPTKQAFMRFQVAGISDRIVTGVHLRIYNSDGSSDGGRLYPVTDNSWSESSTWDTRPTIDESELLGSIGGVTSGSWYDIALSWPDFPTVDGAVSIGMESTSADGAQWHSRESTHSPQLIVDVERVPGLVLDGLSQVATPYEGATEPTYYASNHHLAITAGGRLLTVYGYHATGVQLAWRDPGGGWQETTTGQATDGVLLSNGGTGKKPASISVASDPNDVEHAWVVWSEPRAGLDKPVEMRRLSDLDAPGGPIVESRVTVNGSGLGNAKADVAFETQPDGRLFGAVAWVQKTGSTSYETRVTWFTDLTTDQPAFEATTTVVTSTNVSRVPTIVSTAAGLRLVVRTTGKLQVFGHNVGDPLTTWWSGASGLTAATASAPSAVALASGDVLAAVETDTTNHVVGVERFSSDGSTAILDLPTITGYSQPSLATDGQTVWMVMIRKSDGFVVSRARTLGVWDGVDRLEVGAEGGGGYAWPNLLRQTDGRLRFVVDGPGGSPNQNAVLAFQRLLSAP